MAKETRNTCELKTPFQTTTPRQQVYEPRKLIKHKPLYRVVLKWPMSHNTDYNSSGFVSYCQFYWVLPGFYCNQI
ncbi:hypothetical protein TNCV_1370331 [Trichonephila clavipes]|nr:hypothetical protein TNCV_1370331 [Trichonephila clavipes]